MIFLIIYETKVRSFIIKAASKSHLVKASDIEKLVFANRKRLTSIIDSDTISD